jgi:cold shock CspA family protein
MDDAPLTVPLGDGRGVVETFDDPRGLGTVRSGDGVEYPFHCTAIADGSRSIDVGAEVTWSVAAGRLGRWEAVDLAPAPSGDTLRP